MKFLAKACVVLLPALCPTLFANENTNPPASQIITFPIAEGKLTLKGYLFKPTTPGPHPVIVWNHGSPRPLLQFGSVTRFDDFARFFLQHDFVLFIPDRRAREVVFSDGKIADPNDQETLASTLQTLRDALNVNHEDFRSAVDWLKKQPYVDKTKIFVGGYSAGATQAMYEAGLNSEIRGFVLFTPASQWNNSPFLQKMMLTAAKTSKAPIYIAQAQNDFHLEAISSLGQELGKKGSPNATFVYPPHGSTQKDANLLALTGVSVWSYDVAQFLDAALKN